MTDLAQQVPAATTARSANGLSRLFEPASIAIVGASARPNRATSVLRNLEKIGFPGTVYLVNPRYEELHGYRCFPSVSQLPETVDSLVVAVEAETACRVVEEAFEAGIRAATVLSAGFGEGGAGRERADRLRVLAEQGMAICGPNCYGVVNFAARVATYSGPVEIPAGPGNLGLVSQSGGLANNVLCSLRSDRGIDFRYVVGCGNQLGVTVEDYIGWMVDDPGVRVVGAIVESLKAPGRLREVAERARRLKKTIVLHKIGRSKTGELMIQSHTGALAGDAVVFAAFMRRCGVVQIDDYDSFVEALALFDAVPEAPGDGEKIAVIAGSGGGAAIISDVLEEAPSTVRLIEFSERTRARLSDIMPGFGSITNPLDGTGAMFEDATLLPGILDAISAGETGVTILGTIGARSDNFNEVWRFVGNCYADAARSGATLVAVQHSPHGPLDPTIVSDLREAGVPLLLGSRAAIQAMKRLPERHRIWSRTDDDAAFGGPSAAGRIQAAPGSSSASVYLKWRPALAAAGVPVVEASAVASAEEAVALFERLGVSVVVKADHEALMHKSDLGCVVTGCHTAEMVARAYRDVLERATSAVGPGADIIVQPMVDSLAEVFIGVTSDPLYGPAVSLGLGGIYIELINDSVTEMAPLSKDRALAMIAAIRGGAILTGARGRPKADVDALADCLVGVSRFAMLYGRTFRTLDLNPVIVGPVGQGVSAVDIAVETTPSAHSGE